ncbi:MAG: transposase [bacterium]
MPRKPRLDIPGYLYHVIIRGIEKRLIFKDSRDYNEFLRRFGEILEEEKGISFAWALMPNHAHMLVRSGVNGLASIMRKVLTGYAVYFNGRHKRVGHLFQNRYRSTLCDMDAYLLMLIRYIHLNPLKAKIVKNINELNNYTWTGHSVIMGKKQYSWQDVNSVLALFNPMRAKAVTQYLQYIQEGRDEEVDLEGGGLMRSTGEKLLTNRKTDHIVADERILGGRPFVETVLDESNVLLKHEQEENAHISFDNFLKNIAQYYQINISALLEKNRSDLISIPRSTVSYFGVKVFGKSYMALAKMFKMSESSIYRMINRFERLYDESARNKIKKDVL